MKESFKDDATPNETDIMFVLDRELTTYDITEEKSFTYENKLFCDET